MNLPQTSALGYHVEWLTSSPSTNQALRERWQQQPDLPHGTLLVTDRQTSGRGRNGRGWETSPGKALAASLLVRNVNSVGLSWVPLIVGSAAAQALAQFYSEPNRVGVKWPNDVHVLTRDGRLGSKLCGILCEVLPDGAIIVGVGTNLLLTGSELPTERAGSLITTGAEVDGAQTLADEQGKRIADAYLSELVAGVLDRIAAAESDPQSMRQIVLEDSATVGTRVRVHFPGDAQMPGVVRTGVAMGLAEDGALTVQFDSGETLSVHAGDVEHVREAWPDVPDK